MVFFFSSRRRHTRCSRDWSSDVCSSDLCRRTARIHARDSTSASVQIAHEIAGEVRRRVHLNVHDRLENRWTRARHRVFEGETAGHLERELVRVYVVIRAVEYRHAEIHHRIPGEETAHTRFLNPFFHGRNELPWNRAAEDIVDELEVFPTRQWLDLDLAVAELPVAAGLFFVPAVRLGGTLDRLAVRNARWLQVDVDTEPALQLGDGH